DRQHALRAQRWADAHVPGDRRADRTDPGTCASARTAGPGYAAMPGTLRPSRVADRRPDLASARGSPGHTSWARAISNAVLATPVDSGERAWHCFSAASMVAETSPKIASSEISTPSCISRAKVRAMPLLA